MNAKERLIWTYSIAFLRSFRHLSYDRVPLAPLLLRHVQRYCQSRSRLSAVSTKVPGISPSRIQQQCERYYPKANADYSKIGVTLVRSQLFLTTKGIKDESFVYVAHHAREYRKMRRIKACRPLVYLPALKESPIAAVHERRVWKSWSRISASRHTPLLFRSRSFQTWIRPRLKQMLKNIRKVRTLFRRYPIARTIYGSTINPQGSLLASYSQTRKVPVVNIQHGIFGTLGHLPVNADVNFVWGESHARFLQSYGADPHRLIVSGPFFYRNTERSKLRVSTLSEVQPLTLLVALQPLGYSYNRTLISRIERAAAGNRSIQIRYKLHPDQGNGAIYRQWIRRKRSSLIPHGKRPLTELLRQSDIVITPFSSVAYEALTMNIPVLFYGRRTNIYYLKHEPVYFRTSQRLRTILIRVARSKAYLNRLKRRVRLLDTSANFDPKEIIWSVLKSKHEEAVQPCKYWPSSPPDPDPKDFPEKTSKCWPDIL